MYRLLEYYSQLNWPIIVADSSTEPFRYYGKENVHVIHAPNFSFTQKIESILQQVQTSYCVMCADDDFIIPNAIKKCCDFLDGNLSYSAAQGRAIRYYRESVATGRIRFGLLYNGETSVENENPLLRIGQMFQPYRSLLYAVHRVDVLKQCFKQAGEKVSNLYLNEYLTAIVPVAAGKTKEFNFLYQIRESADDSDDKTTDNLDTILHEPKYQQEYERFLELQTDNSFYYTGGNKQNLKEVIDAAFKEYALQLRSHNSQRPSFKKRMGNLISFIPALGKILIAANRRKEYRMDMQRMVQTTDDRNELKTVERILLQHINL